MAQDKAGKTRQDKTKQGKARHSTPQHSTQVPGRMHQQKPTTRGREGGGGGAPVTLLSNPDFTTYVRDRRNGNWIPKEHLLHTRARGGGGAEIERNSKGNKNQPTSAFIGMAKIRNKNRNKIHHTPPPSVFVGEKDKKQKRKKQDPRPTGEARRTRHRSGPEAKGGCLTNHTINIINSINQSPFCFFRRNSPGGR